MSDSNPNTAYQSLLERRSIRSYEDTPVSEEALDLILKAGQYAPTAMGRQATAFLAVSNPEIRAVLSRLNAEEMAKKHPGYDKDPFYGAPMVIAVFADGRYSTAMLDGAAAMENMLLAISDLGLGGCWINRAKEVFRMPEGAAIQKLFEIPEAYEGIGFVICGVPKEAEAPKAAARISLVRKAL